VTTLLGIAVVLLSLWIVALTTRAPKAMGQHEPNAERAGSAGEAGGGLLYAFGDGGAASAPDAGSPLLLTDLLDRNLRAADEPEGGAAGAVLPDGSPVPRLPMGAPRQVRFGVALVAYAGAQQAVGARPITRARDEARALADRLLATAQQDFHGAVQQGDVGSTDDLGLVKTGILEPAPEYVLFTLPVGGVGGPVDTPRGYWIVKRLE
ncbi:MAG: hypothetical protein JOZ69_12725, partial [Myxococcales bacterium]|nr:hypothetical protein [Myxococcales bacterium]